MNDNHYKIEVRGKYSADVEVEGRATAAWVIGAAQARGDVSLVRIFNRDQVATFAWENGKWVRSGSMNV